MSVDNLTIQAPSHDYSVAIRRDGGEELIAWLAEMATAGRALLITDETVAPLYGHSIVGKLNGCGIQTTALIMGEGESNKTLSTVESLYDSALRTGVDRETLVIALGGGVVGDVAGYLAATLLRGLPLVHVPTTVIAQVDSSIGGKTGVNLRHGKNLVGSFYSPRGVFIDVSLLDTLPIDERRAGLAEAVKHGAIADTAILTYVERNHQRLNDMIWTISTRLSPRPFE